MTDDSRSIAFISADNPFGKLPDHLLIEIFIRVPISEWVQLSCVKKQWANLFQEDCLWHAALLRSFPLAAYAKRWPGPIPRGKSKRRYTALCISKHMFSLDDELDEILGHTYLFLKGQLEISTMPPPAGILHGTIIVKKFRKAHRPNPERDSEDNIIQQPEEPNNERGDDLGKSTNADPATEAEDDDDDFIMNEVKRKLKELRRNSFLVLIPEESGMEDEEEEEEEEGERSSGKWGDVEAEGQQPWCGFNAVFKEYCDRMLFFDRLSAQQLNEVGSYDIPATPLPRSASKKLMSPLSCLSLKKTEEPENETEHLQQPPENDPHQDLETAYVGQVCLTWEALHCQYTQLSQKISSQPENSASYNHIAQQVQQFQVLLQRYIENEPFEQGFRAETYARLRNSLPKLLQVPNMQDIGKTEGEESDLMVLLADLVRIIEHSILTFHLFLKMDKKKSSGVRNLFGGQNQLATPLQQIQSSLDKKEMKLKELRKRKKGWKKKSWPATREEVELLFGLIDVKVLSRVLRMVRITNEQLFWCEEKMKKLDLSDGKLMRDPSPILFPC